MTGDFSKVLQKKTELVNDVLTELLGKQTEMDSGLKEALRYTLEAPGKRIRSALVLFCCELISGRVNHNARIAAAAVEMVHTYSLIHDDLPAVDNDNMRRGLPTCHKAFDEATAILAGDALLTIAFEVLSTEIDKAATAIKLIRQLAEAVGGSGMIAGQMADLRAENQQGSEQLLEYIHTNKTAKMFRCSAAMGSLCGGADEKQLNSLCEYGLKIGLSFQIADDLLDVCSSSEQLGKTAGKDAKAAKCTYPAIVGMEKSRQKEKQLCDEAIAALDAFGPEAEVLRNLAKILLERKK